MKDNRDPEKLGEALLEMRKHLPELKLSEIADIHSKIGNSEAGSLSLNGRGRPEVIGDEMGRRG